MITLTRTVVAATLLGSVCTVMVCGASSRTLAEPRVNSETLERFLRPEGPLLRTYRARRTLEASTMGGRMQAEIEAWTSVDAAGRFHFEVLRATGSELIRQRVLVKALETEQRSYEPGERGRAELTQENYAFFPSEGADDFVSIALHPHRPNPMLLDGTVIVRRATGEVERLVGSLSEMPSWWTRHVDIVRVYARVAGVSVPVEMASRADIRVAGDSTFRMVYHYAAVNGQAVAR